MGRFPEKFRGSRACDRAITLIKSILPLTLPGLAATLLSAAAQSQESSSLFPVLLPAPGREETSLAPNFRVATFPLESLDADNAAPDTPADPSPRQGFIKRSISRIGGDQKRLYLAPFKPHNFKWAALVLVGTAAFLAADRHIEHNVP